MGRVEIRSEPPEVPMKFEVWAMTSRNLCHDSGSNVIEFYWLRIFLLVSKVSESANFCLFLPFTTYLQTCIHHLNSPPTLRIHAHFMPMIYIDIPTP